MSQTKEIQLPDIGDFHDVEVIEILVSPGDRIEPDQSLITLESDKATMEIPSPEAGVVKEVKVAIGDKINQGDVIVTVESEEATAGETAEAEPETAAEPQAPPVAAEPEPPSASSVPTSSGGGERLPVTVPDIGDFKNVEVVEVLVSDGDRVEKEGSLITLETDKATMEIPSPAAGTVRGMKIQVGDRVNQGDLICELETDAAEPAPEPTAAAQQPTSAPRPEPIAAATQERLPGEKAARKRPVIAKPSDAPKGRAHASPGVRRFARELGVDIYHVPGTGPKGRITKEDVQNFVKRTLAEGAPQVAATGPLQLPRPPEVDFSQFGEIEEVELGRIKKLSGKHLHNAWLGIPHVTQFDEADITELEAFRKDLKAQAEKEGVKLTFMPFLMKALAAALKEYPQFNASLAPDTEKLILKKYVHIGVAVDTPNGLMVPVVRDVDRKGIFELARDLMDVSSRAREGKLAPADMQGGCISISSLGGIGGTQFTPIVNSPEVAILGVSRAEMKPKWNGSDFEPRLIMPFSLSYDHRVIDGAEGVRFTTYLAQLLGEIRRLLL
ncbi:MAG: dihydrolipoyllysine-residue acetyltransferase [Gammaproteobacteria bacterium]|nr:MAG: dihydrolipoyllysine-residue acetyltransferase [Gammaproteobacteria bacterium]